MAISETQKVDYLWKKLAYGLSKTDTNANKRATNESISSPLLLRGANVWAQSNLIPGVIPGSSTDFVTVYPTSSPDETTADSSATLNRTWKTGLIDWIPPEYGSTYLIKVYIHTAGQPGSAASGGTQVFGAGSGNNDEWFFDYQSGILHFIGTNLPSGISGKSVYVSGARYTGIKGVAVPGAAASFTDLNITGISTFVDNVQISSLTNNRIAIVGSGSTIEDDANLTFDGSTLVVGVDLDVDGHTELDDVNVSTALTANNLIVTGSTLLSHSNSLKLQTTGIGISVSNGVGLTATIAGPTNLIIDPGVVGDNTGIVRIKGDLFVDGEQTQINSTTIELADFIVGVATTATSDLLTDGAGIQIGPNNTFLYEFNSGTNPSLKSSENLNVASGKVYQINQTERLSADTLSLGTGTTIHSPVSNALTFGTNGTEKVRITSDGDVGIGSVIPAGKLDVVGHTELDTLNVSGIATFVGDIATNANLDVDGRTELDITNIDETLNVVGIATFAELITSNNGLIVTGVSTFNSNVELPNGQHLILGDGFSNSGNFKLYNGSNEPFEIFGSSKETYIRNTGSNANGIIITANGSVTLGGGGAGSFSVHAAPDGTARLSVNTVEKLRTDPSGVIVTGILTANTFVGDGDFVELDVDGRTELDITNISETLNVVGIVTFANNIDANGDLDVDGRTELDITNIAETLNVVGISTFASNVDVNADLDVDGHTELDNLNVSGVSTFASDIDINASIDVDGHTELDDLNVSGVSTFASNVDLNADLDVDGRTELDITNISETLNVVGIATFASNLDLNADLDVDGRTELDITNISETLNVTGISTFENNVNVGGALSVTGNAFFVGMVTFAAGADGNITIGNANTDNVIFNADIDSSFIPDDTQTYDLGSSSQEWRNVFSKDIKVSTLTQNRVVFAGVNGKLQTSGNLEFIDGSQLTVGASLTVTGSLDVDGRTELDITNISETLNVVGITTFANNIDANGDLDVDGRTELDITNISETLNVTGISTFASDIDINASIDVDGHTELDDVNVSGASTFTGAIDANGDLDVDGRTELDITNISETLNVTGISTFASDIDINASIDVDGHTELDNLNVSGVSTFVSNVNLSSNLDVDGQTDLDVLNVSETATFSSNIDANGNLDVDGTTDLDVLNVAETATFSSNIDANGNLDVDGTTELDVLNVAETATFSSNIDANGNLDVDGHTELDNLNVSGVSTFASAVDINADLDVDGRTELDITNISETLNVTGIATFANNIDANGDLDVDGTTELDVLNVAETATFNGRIVGSATTNVIPFLYSSLSDLPSASTYHGAFAHVHATGRAYYAHGGNWIELVNKNTSGNVILGGDLDVDGHTELDNVNISGVATATAFHTGALGSAIRITSDTISGPSEIIIDPAGVGDNTGALRIKGDLFVDGTQTVINSTSIELADFIVGIATTATTDNLADGAGIQIGPNNTLLYDNANTSLKSSENLNLASGKKYKINGTDVLSATTLGTNVVNSSLTSLGIIATGVWQGTAINDDYIDTIDNANKVSISALNIDGGTDIGALLADGDLIIVDDGAGGTNRKADVVGITTYTFSKVSGDVVISASGAATIQANSVALATDTTGDFVQSISGTTNEVTVSVTSGENVQPQIGLPDDVIVTTSLKVGTGITAQGGIITATTFVGNGDFVDIDVDGHTELDDLKVTGVSTFTGVIEASAGENKIPSLYSNTSDLPSAGTYHGMFAHVHATGKGYYAHANNWIELVNKEVNGVTGTGTENYNVGVVTATSFDGDINLDGNNITGTGSVNITGIITAAALNVGTGGTVISANADTGTFAIGSATTSITATMNGGAIPSIGLVIALGG